jgi:hypothetical protein
MSNSTRKPSTEGNAPTARSDRFARYRRLLRRHRRVLGTTLLTLYVMSGILVMAPGELRAAQALLHIAIGITHWLA